MLLFLTNPWGIPITISKHRALSREVTCNLRLYLKIAWTRVKPSWKHWIFTSNYRCLCTCVRFNTALVGITQMSRLNARCLPISIGESVGYMLLCCNKACTFPVVTSTYNVQCKGVHYTVNHITVDHWVYYTVKRFTGVLVTVYYKCFYMHTCSFTCNDLTNL